MVKITWMMIFSTHVVCGIKKGRRGRILRKNKNNKETTFLATDVVLDSKRSDEQLAQDNERVDSSGHQTSFVVNLYSKRKLKKNQTLQGIQPRLSRNSAHSGRGTIGSNVFSPVLLRQSKKVSPFLKGRFTNQILFLDFFG
jgi:hypothetical protein